MKLVRYVLGSLVLLVLFSSCEQKGCTDPNAVNYDITANTDDGSCIICQNITNLYDNLDVPLVDKKPSSIYYNDTVGIFHLVQYLRYPTDRVCGEEVSYITMELQNLVSQNMLLEFNIEDVLGPINFYYGSNTSVSALGTREFGTVLTMNYPPFHKISLDSLKVTLSGYIQYY